MNPKKLIGGEMVAAYDPAEPPPPIELTTVTFYPPPLYLMSPGIRVYRAEDIKTMKAYVSRFEPAGFDESNQPVATVTITPIGE